jgi:hypothetical protein
MKIFRTLGFAAAVVGLASWFDGRGTRRRELRRERERLDRTRWEGEGGATPRGPHLSETWEPATESPRTERAPATPPLR